MKFTFQVPGKPVPQGSMRLVGRGHMIHSNPDLLPYRATVAAYALTHRPQEWEPTGAMAVDARFALPRPMSHYRKDGRRKDSAPWWPTRRVGDLDKFVRTLFDALSLDAGIIRDDAQIVHLTAQKCYADGAGHMSCTIQRITDNEL